MHELAGVAELLERLSLYQHEHLLVILAHF